MIKHGDTIVWSASDLTSAAECEYGFLRKLDRKLGRAETVEVEEDQLQRQIADLGLAHEARVLAAYQAAPGTTVLEVGQAASAQADDLNALVEATKAAFEQKPEVVFQAGFFDGEFHGYADFIRWTPDGWVVVDTKIARTAKTSALLQIAAYADQLETWGLAVAPTAELKLGSGETQSFPVADLLPFFRERRARLRFLIAGHQAQDAEAAWNAAGITACGKCEDCTVAIELHQDLFLVANLRKVQRRKLLDDPNNPITTMAELAAAESGPDTMSASTFAKLQRQAGLQLEQRAADAAAGPDDEPVQCVEVINPKPLRELPDPSPGDLFFDFEGDPMFGAEGEGRWGLEYLWGVVPVHADGSGADYWYLWADDRATEQKQLGAFLDQVAAIRQQHPDMHVYHYAPYEITALKRLVAGHVKYEDELDDLLRHGVFVDLYKTVRGSIMVGQPSYSIKKLELYYLEEARLGDVTKADQSIAEYHHYRDLIADDPESVEAQEIKRSLLLYNEKDCQSTLELRDWLLALADAHVGDAVADPLDEPVEQQAAVDDPELKALSVSLLVRAGSVDRAQRTADEQAWAMLEGSLGYYKREDRPFWWAHFDRLMHMLDEWADSRDVVAITDVVELAPWGKTGKQRLERRKLSITGKAGDGTTLADGADVRLVYPAPGPEAAEVPTHGLYGATNAFKIESIENHVDGTCTLVLEEIQKADTPTYPDLPIAVVPGKPIPSGQITNAIRALAAEMDAAGELGAKPAIDILARRTPRLVGGGALPHTGDDQADLVAALLALDHSYVAVQGPPGTGKTFRGSHVIAELVNKHRWNVGVVAQSHAVVENMFDGLVKAGLDPQLIGKRDKRSSDPKSTWVGIEGPPAKMKSFCDERAGAGYVVGGTAWTFTGAGVEPESLDLLVIDEAGQFSLASTVGVSISARRLLLLGDPQQLPQVSQGCHGEPVDTSALGWVMGKNSTMPAEFGYFLEHSYRMHPAVSSKISTLSYGGALGSAAAASARSLHGVEPGVRVVRVAHQDNNISSLQEADEVVRQIQTVLGTLWHDPDEKLGSPRPLVASDVMVVAPYNAQRLLVGQRLKAAGLSGVKIGTVDKFQGQEAPVVLVSMTASSAEDVPRGMEFLLNRNRVNVAVSRAQWLAIVLRSQALSAHMPTSPERLLELGGFIGLCENDDAPAGGTESA